MIAVIGAGGHAKVVIASLAAAGREIGGVFDDDESTWGQKILGHPIEGPPSRLDSRGQSHAIIAVGDNESRKALARKTPAKWVSVVHPAALMDRSSTVGAGSVVFAGTVLQPAVEIGEHVIVNTAASIDHDCVVGDFSHIAPGATLGGDVRLGEGVLVGIGATIAPGIVVGNWATIGAGAVVVRDVPTGDTVVGVPARPFERSGDR